MGLGRAVRDGLSSDEEKTLAGVQAKGAVLCIGLLAGGVIIAGPPSCNAGFTCLRKAAVLSVFCSQQL